MPLKVSGRDRNRPLTLLAGVASDQCFRTNEQLLYGCICLAITPGNQNKQRPPNRCAFQCRAVCTSGGLLHSQLSMVCSKAVEMQGSLTLSEATSCTKGICCLPSSPGTCTGSKSLMWGWPRFFKKTQNKVTLSGSTVSGRQGHSAHMLACTSRILGKQACYALQLCPSMLEVVWGLDTPP